MSLIRSLFCLTLVLTVVACGSSAQRAADAGSSTTDAGAAAADAGSRTTDAGAATTDAGTADNCQNPQTSFDCSDCATQKDCQSCFSTADQDGVEDYNALANCVFCTACYHACDSASQPGECTAAPTKADSCDNVTGSDKDCQNCVQCATGASGSCSQQASACAGNPSCRDIEQNLSSTCSSLPQ